MGYMRICHYHVAMTYTGLSPPFRGTTVNCDKFTYNILVPDYKPGLFARILDVLGLPADTYEW